METDTLDVIHSPSAPQKGRRSAAQFLWVLIPVLILAGAIVWRIGQKKQAEAMQAQGQEKRKNAPKPVATAPVVTRDLVTTWSGIGTVESPNNVKIAPKITGRIVYLHAREGDPVKKGQLLAQIDGAQVEADVRQAQANVAEARSRLAQAQIGQNPATVAVQTAVSQMSAALQSDVAAYRQAQAGAAAQNAAAAADVTDAQSRVDAAAAAIANAQAQVASAEANANHALLASNRAVTLNKQGYMATQDVEDAQAELKVMQSNVAVANGQLSAAHSQKDSALAQKKAAQQEADVTRAKGISDIAAAAAKVKQDRAALAAAKANTAQTAAYRENLAALQSSVAAAEAQLHSAEAQRADTVLKSPIDGVVADRTLDPGSVAGPQQPILSVVSLARVWLTVPIPEEVSHKIADGQTAEVTFDALPGRSFVSRVSQINPSVDPQSRQFNVRFTLDNPGALIKPGMFGRVSLVTDRVRNAVVIPREALQTKKGQSVVSVVGKNNEVVQKAVVTGASDPSGIQVLSGVNPGDQVVVLTATPLKEGAKVKTGGGGGGKGRRGKPSGGQNSEGQGTS